MVKAELDVTVEDHVKDVSTIIENVLLSFFETFEAKTIHITIEKSE